MRIGVTCYPTYGGSGVVAAELGMELAARGHQVHFISYARPIRLHLPDSPAMAANLHYHEVEVTTYPLFEHAPYTLALATRMAEVAEAERLDLLHVHYAIPHSVSAYLARAMLRETSPAAPLPFVTTLHGTDITLVGSDHSYLPITRFAIEQSDGVTAISHYLRDTTYREFEVRRDIRVIYNFVNCDIYRPERDDELYAEFAPNGEPLVVHLSNFRPVKRVTEVIDIFARVRRHLRARLLMIGEGPERGNAEYQARKCGVEKDVLFLGKQDDVYRLLPLSDVLLLPSLTESFGLAALEAMACGAVPVASRVGGLPEVITDGQDGFLNGVGDVEGMAKHVLSLLGDRDLRCRMGEAARQTAQQRFCSTTIIPEYEQFYRQVLGRV
jgi:N-acetyl-alpha-D-glucosaminyl L-malate synthase BshA